MLFEEVELFVKNRMSEGEFIFDPDDLHECGSFFFSSRNILKVTNVGKKFVSLEYLDGNRRWKRTASGYMRLNYDHIRKIKVGKDNFLYMLGSIPEYEYMIKRENVINKILKN